MRQSLRGGGTTRARPPSSAAREFSPCLASRKLFVPSTWAGGPKNRGRFMVERTNHGHWLPGRSANPSGRPGVPEVIKTRLRELSPRAVARLGELLDSGDERIQLEAARAILDRYLGRPAIQADINLNPNAADNHLAALVEMARRRALEPIMLEDVEVEATATSTT